MKSHVVDRSRWPSGPWDSEPDRIEFTYKGFPCLVVRVDIGSLCGYVAVDRSHPFYGKHYDEVHVKIHGGLTYSDHCRGHVCHVPKAGEPDDVWWLGFDCAHFGDQVPGLAAFHVDEDSRYRDVAYVTKEIKRLADQLLDAKSH